MSTKSRLLLQAATLMLLASAAHAQDTAPTGGSATSAASATAAPDEEIVVTGIRASLKSAQSVKRNSVQIVDSVVAEDIGKLPDISVADTAARIAGVQVYRQGGEASNVLVRGLPFFETTYDGREIFTAETRYVALQDFPSQNVAALQVFKTSTADLVEPGLAGLVNVVSRRPFDFAGFELSASAQANYGRNSDQWRPQGNFLISDRWQTGIGEMGLLVNASFTELRYLDNELSNTDFIADPTVNGQRIRLPDITRLYDRSGDRARPSVNAAFQWKPSSVLEFYAGVLWQGFRNRIDDRLIEADLYNAISYNSLTFRPGTNLVSGGSITGGNQLFTFQGGTYNKTDTFQYSGGLKWDSGRLHGAVDVARTNSTFRGSTESVDRRFLGTPTITFDNSVPEFAVSGLTAPNSANGFLFQGLYEENQRSAGRGWQGRADLTYDVDNELLNKIRIGVRYTDRSVFRNFGNRYAYLLPLGINASTLPVRNSVFDAGFADTNVQGLRNFSSPLYGSIRDNLVTLRQFVIANCAAIVATGDTGNGCRSYTTTSVSDPSVYTATEDTLAGYFLANYHIGDLIDGAFGVRAVNTREGQGGFTNKNEFLDALPNWSARIKFTPKFQGRLSYSETRTLPNFDQFNFSTARIQTGRPATGGLGTISDPYSFTQGNPNLHAYHSTNYDTSLEFYASPTSYFAVAYFHRDLNGFIQNLAIINPADPGLGYTITNLAYNSGKGYIDGFELQGQTFLDIKSLPGWLRGFGAQASVTWLNAKTQNPDFTSGRPGPLTFQRLTDQLNGTSKFLYSVVGLYEYGPLSARITVNGRSSFLASQQARGTDYYYEWAKPAPRVDGSINFSVNKRAQLFFDWTNLTGEPFRQYFSSARAGAPRADEVRYIRYDESVMSAGVRFRY